MKKWLIGVLLVLLLAIGLFYWQRLSIVNEQLEQFASSLGEFGQLSWESVFIDPRGRVVVRDPAFKPHQEVDTIRAESLTLHSADLEGLLPARPGLGSLQGNEAWLIDMRGLRLPIGQLVSGWQLERLGLLLPLRTRACPGFERPTLGDLLRIGYGRLEMNVELAVKAEGDRMLIDVDVEAHGLSATRQRWSLSPSGPIASLEDARALVEDGSLEALEVQIQDRGLLGRIDEACGMPTASDGIGSDDPRFRAWLRAWTDQGLEPYAIAQAAFRYHLEKPADAISIIARPDHALPLALLGNSIDSDLIERLHLAFSIGEGPEIPLQVREVTSTRIVEVTPPAPEQTTSVLRSVDDEESTIVVGRPPEWERIELDSIADYIGYQVRAEFIDGTTQAGFIAGLEADQIELLTQSRMGEFVRPIPLDSIRSVEVRP